MAYLPTEPIIPFLRRKVDENVLRQGRPASGIEQITWELSRITGHALRSCERQVVRILRGHVTQLWDRTAEHLAQALGYGPEAIWGDDWYALADVPLPTRDVRVTWEAMARRMTLRVSFERDGRLIRAHVVEIPEITAVGSDREEVKAQLLKSLDEYMRGAIAGKDTEQLAVVIPRIALAS